MYLAEGIELKSDYKTNQNVVVIGSPGTGKTRGHVVPGIMSATGSMVVLDPKGELYDMTNDMMASLGYKVRCLNVEEPFNTSSFYNPLVYIRSGINMGDDIIKITNVLVSDLRRHSIDVFWANTAQLLANAIIGYLVESAEKEERTFENMLRMIRLIECTTDKSSLDILMEEWGKTHKSSFAVEQYELFKTVAASEKTYASIVISLVSTLGECMTKGMCYLTGHNTIDFDELGTRETIIYIRSSDTDRSKDKIIEMFFHQAFIELCRIADSKKKHCLDMHVHFFLDDFGTNLKIANFDNYIAGMRSREMSCSIILQSESQLKKMFAESWSTIMASCQSYVFLGSNDLDTCRNISERVNRPLDEILYKEYDDVYLFAQGEKPKKCKRYDIKKDVKYHMLHEL